MALDEISYDLAVSRGRLPNTDSAENTCCKLPGTEFLSSKFWRRTEGWYSISRFSSSGNIQSLHAVRNIPDKDAITEAYNPDRQRLQRQNRGGFVVDPLADVCSVVRENSGFYSSQMSNPIIQNGIQVRNASGIAEASSATCTVPANLSSR